MNKWDHGLRRQSIVYRQIRGGVGKQKGRYPPREADTQKRVANKFFGQIQLVSLKTDSAAQAYN